LITKHNHIKEEYSGICVHLLQYLCSGITGTPEYELALNKILCGVSLEYPIEKEIDLPEGYKEETEKLLNSAIGHWNALKNTSSDGLRNTFLMCDGKLSLKDGEWKLQVEQKAYDILLNKIPWGFSMIKLPWMKNLLEVEWVY
jgi:hypothetical protein